MKKYRFNIPSTKGKTITTHKANSAIIYISHGGGPLPLMGPAVPAAMNAFLKELAAMLPKPKAVVVISAHCETDPPIVTSHLAPELIYDYYGFPRQAYEIAYPAAGPGSPSVPDPQNRSFQDWLKKICAGAAGYRPAHKVFDVKIMGRSSVCFFGPEAVQGRGIIKGDVKQTQRILF